VGGRKDLSNTVSNKGSGQGQALFNTGRAVINTWQDMTMNIR
jgi:hypothetical protein